MNRYPSEEELERLIHELEKQELYAPKHLKENMMQKIKEAESQEHKILGNATDFQYQKQKRSKAVRILPYSLKVIAGMAAAIVLLFNVPFIDREATNISSYYEYQEEQLSKEMERARLEKEKPIQEEFSYKIKQGNRVLNEKTNNIFNKVNRIFTTNGGEQNES